MDLGVYSVYLVGVMAAYAVAVVRFFARMPAERLARGRETSRFAAWADPADVALDRLTPSGRLVTVDVPKARAA